jgi:predicted DNA-binding transcriptional regulator AlpA
MAHSATPDQAKRGRGRPRKVHTEAADIGRVTTSALPAELIHFDELPDIALVRLPVVKGLYGCSESAIWRNCKTGAIPAPIKLTEQITAWRVGDLRAALNRGVA